MRPSTGAARVSRAPVLTAWPEALSQAGAFFNPPAHRPDMRYHIGVKVRLDAPDGKPLLGEGRAELLELIDETGSLSEAAKGMDVLSIRMGSCAEDQRSRRRACGDELPRW